MAPRAPLRVILETNDIVRDCVMRYLCPADVFDFVNALRIVVPTRDMAQYTSVFKLIVGDTEWMLRMLRDGYSFTAISAELPKLTAKIRPGKQISASQIIHVSLLLVLTKNNVVVNATDDLVPASRIRGDADGDSIVSDGIYINATSSAARGIVLHRGILTIVMGLPITTQSLDSPIVLSPGLCEKSLLDERTLMPLRTVFYRVATRGGSSSGTLQVRLATTETIIGGPVQSMLLAIQTTGRGIDSKCTVHYYLLHTVPDGWRIEREVKDSVRTTGNPNFDGHDIKRDPEDLPSVEEDASIKYDDDEYNADWVECDEEEQDADTIDTSTHDEMAARHTIHTPYSAADAVLGYQGPCCRGCRA